MYLSIEHFYSVTWKVVWSEFARKWCGSATLGATDHWIFIAHRGKFFCIVCVFDEKQTGSKRSGISAGRPETFDHQIRTKKTHEKGQVQKQMAFQHFYIASIFSMAPTWSSECRLGLCCSPLFCPVSVPCYYIFTQWIDQCIQMKYLKLCFFFITYLILKKHGCSFFLLRTSRVLEKMEANMAGHLQGADNKLGQFLRQDI